MRIIIVLIICLITSGGIAKERNLATPPLEIQGARVSLQSDAERIAFVAYVNKMKAKVLATEGVQNMDIVTLGYDVHDFAIKGERIWEARIMTIDGLLRAIIWINPRSEALHFVCGPWEEKVY